MRRTKGASETMAEESKTLEDLKELVETEDSSVVADAVPEPKIDA